MEASHIYSCSCTAPVLFLYTSVHPWRVTCVMNEALLIVEQLLNTLLGLYDTRSLISPRKESFLRNSVRLSFLRNGGGVTSSSAGAAASCSAAAAAAAACSADAA